MDKHTCDCAIGHGWDAIDYCPLHAAAPELLAALEAVFAKCSLGPAAWPRKDDTPEQRDKAALYNLVVFAGETARAAIRKAKGESA